MSQTAVSIAAGVRRLQVSPRLVTGSLSIASRASALAERRCLSRLTMGAETVRALPSTCLLIMELKEKLGMGGGTNKRVAVCGGGLRTLKAGGRMPVTCPRGRLTTVSSHRLARK